jgi:hypothetical protein
MTKRTYFKAPMIHMHQKISPTSKQEETETTKTPRKKRDMIKRPMRNRKIKGATFESFLMSSLFGLPPFFGRSKSIRVS